MATDHVTVTLRMADLQPTRLLIFTLADLASDMRIAADPFAERLEAALARYGRELPDTGTCSRCEREMGEDEPHWSEENGQTSCDACHEGGS